ncbi:ficolin-2-like [Calliphora vicina]|uniref:ficolin-2-like n=1 Tax=Calliphora vicina TaxID=7373 RepID=UPI00325A598B
MSAFQYFVIILLFNLIYLDNTLSYVSKEMQLEGSGLDSDLITLNNNFQLNSNLDINFISQLEKAVDSMLITHIDLLEKRLQNYNEAFFERNIKTYIQKEIRDVNELPNDDNEINCSDDRLPESCFEVKECRNSIFTLMIEKYSDKPFYAACDLETLNSGWTIIQKRQDGSENFFRNWTDYVKGFGKMDGEFFIGLEKLHALTTFGPPQELYIIMDDYEGTRKYARYEEFKVGAESEEFKLNVAKYSGTAGDSLSWHNDCTFSTRDFGKKTDCAQGYRGGWWYNNCFNSNLNGKYLFGKYPKTKYGQGVVWSEFRGYEYSLKFVQMMIRPRQSDD